MNLVDRYTQILESIDSAAKTAGRSADAIKLIAVSKTVGAERIRQARAAGIKRFGENRVQELVRKSNLLNDLEIEWHFIGHIQTNKARLVTPGSDLIHTLDTLKLARLLSKHTPETFQQRILIQVNMTGEESKAGVAPGELAPLLDTLVEIPRLQVEGLMTIGPLGGDRKQIRTAFKNLRLLMETERARQRPNQPLVELSMGMSGDFNIAIEEGATLIRIGTAIFGSRPA